VEVLPIQVPETGDQNPQKHAAGAPVEPLHPLCHRVRVDRLEQPAGHFAGVGFAQQPEGNLERAVLREDPLVLGPGESPREFPLDNCDVA
jgi:hypothetical protein